MIVGYLRVSTGKQNLANQQDEIRRFAESRNFTVNSWVTEVVSGKKNERERKLGTLLKRMKPGDTLIVTEISRLSRTLTDIMAIMGKCLSREINLYTTKEGVLLRQQHQQQSALFCFRTGGGDRAQSDFHAYQRGVGTAQGGGGDARQEKRQLYQDKYLDGQPTGDNRDAQQRQVDRRYLQTFRHIARYVHQIPEKISVRAEGGSGEGGEADCCVWRYEVFFPSGLTIEGNSVLPFPSIACMRKTCGVRPCLHCPAPFRICACRVPSAIREPGRGICAGRIRRVWSRVFHARPPSWPAVRRCRC